MRRALLLAGAVSLGACTPGVLIGGSPGQDNNVPGGDTTVTDAPQPRWDDNGKLLPDLRRTDGPRPTDLTKKDTTKKDSTKKDSTKADATPQIPAKFFRASSLWNTPIANQSVQWRDEPGMRSASWWINYDAYSNPVVFGSASDPLVNVTVPNTWGWPAGVIKLRIPANVTGAAGTDAILVVVDGTTVYDFWQFVRDSNTTAHVTAWAKNDMVTGSGWGSYSPFLGAGIRAAGSSGLAGEIFGNELTQGINHALAFSATSGSGLFGSTRPPAIASDGPAEGTRVGIPPGTQKPGTLSPQGSRMWDALKTYGAWLVDRIDGAAPCAFNADPRSVPKADVNALFGDLDKITPALRVVDHDYPYNP